VRDDRHAHPVPPGRGASDYECYRRTDELLELQKTAEERVHHDELLFQTVHQSSELWLKLACTEVDEVDEVDEAATAIERGAPAAATRLLRPAILALQYVTTSLEMLNQMDPWECLPEAASDEDDLPHLARGRGVRKFIRL
jgi:tryptophan 2,3-dioxygenase